MFYGNIVYYDALYLMLELDWRSMYSVVLCTCKPGT